VTARAWTVVSFHAHPDDEVLLTGGTLARLAAEGHRVVLIIATDGAAGLADSPAGIGLATRRAAELDVAAAALGVSRLVCLGYPDSGDDGCVVGGLATAETAVVAERVAAVLIEEQAAVLTTYDGHGGYGHPDHVAVHRIGAEAARLAGTRLVLEATVDATSLARVTRVLCRLPGVPRGVHAGAKDRYATRATITHRVNVGPYCAQKRAAMQAHVSQATAPPGSDLRTLALLLKLPSPLFRLALGREWYVETGRPPGPPLDDIFATLRSEP
jgi:LmbE family N-acetylglucosaminyl deacetylase